MMIILASLLQWDEAEVKRKKKGGGLNLFRSEDGGGNLKSVKFRKHYEDSSHSA